MSSAKAASIYRKRTQMSFKSFLFLLSGIVAGWTLHMMWFRSSSWRRYKKNQKNHEMAHRMARRLHPTNSQDLDTHDWMATEYSKNVKKHYGNSPSWQRMPKWEENRKKGAYGSGRMQPEKNTSFYRQMNNMRKPSGSPDSGKWYSEE